MMLLYNKCGRYDVAEAAVRGVLHEGKTNSINTLAHSLISQYQHKNRYLVKYAQEHGEDPPEFQQAVLLEA